MKRLFSLIAVVSVLFCMNSFAEGQKDSESGKKPVIMKIGHSISTNTSRHQSLLKFKEMVEERTDGAVVVEIYPSGQLGTEMEMLEAVKMGTIEGTRCGSFEDAAPELLIYTMPFLFRDMDEVHRVTRGPITERIIKNTEKNGLKVLAVGDAGEFRQFFNNTRPITQLSDMVGLKLRTPPMESIVKIVEALGANPVSIPFSETYMALKTGVADGAENSFANIEKMKFYEVQKYLSIINYQYHAEMLYVPLDWFNSLDKDIQDILIECAQEHMILNDEYLKEETQISYEFLKDNMEINVFSDAQRQTFMEKAQPVYDYYIKKGTFSQSEIDEIRKTARGN